VNIAHLSPNYATRRVVKNKSPYSNGVPGDLNDDGIVNFEDLFLFRKIYLYGYDPRADFDKDGKVDYYDLNFFRLLYLLP